MAKRVVEEVISKETSVPDISEILTPDVMEIECNIKSNISLRGAVLPFPKIPGQDDKVTGIIISKKN